MHIIYQFYLQVFTYKIQEILTGTERWTSEVFYPREGVFRFLEVVGEFLLNKILLFNQLKTKFRILVKNFNIYCIISFLPNQ